MSQSSIPMRGFITIYGVLLITSTVYSNHWSTWESWGSCSVTCGQGQQLRNRTCTNQPLLGGTTCLHGNRMETRTCFVHGCLDGQWSKWASWSHCSSSTHVKSRTRQCDSPAPSLYGLPCEGIGEQFTTCQGSTSTTQQSVLFSAHNPVDRAPDVGSNVVYSEVITNVGQGYDNTTGNFTTPVSGIYSFYVQLCGSVGKHVAIKLTAMDRVISVMDYSGENYGCRSTQAVTTMPKGGVVKVVVTDTARYGFYETSVRWNMFSGYLVHA